MIIPDFKTQHFDDLELMLDLEHGLSKERKAIPSKYFYDQKGCDLFNAITHHSDYYLTQCEIEILNSHIKTIADLFSREAFNLVELGPGEGIKTKIILDQLIKDNLSFTYMPIDISKKYLDDLSQEFLQTFPDLQLKTIQADWIEGLKHLDAAKRNIILFLGSSIGNFTPQAGIQFLREIAASLKNGGYIFIGFDLCKDEDILLRAYDDSDGITRQFNFNLLDRINKNLGGDFDISQFAHKPRYNTSEDAMESYLVSMKNQLITIRSINKTFNLNLNEEIHVESSYKYRLERIEHMARESGLRIINNFYDAKKYFLCSLWEVV
jgi:L-histidine Nalpha-methyltransferase